MKAGLYIHIPFCESRCIYCGFYSTTAKDWRTRYVDALLKEMHMRSGELKEVLRGGSLGSKLTLAIGYVAITSFSYVLLLLNVLNAELILIQRL